MIESTNPSEVWQKAGILTAIWVVLWSGIKRIFSPFAASQVRDALKPDFDALHDKLREAASSVAHVNDRFDDLLRQQNTLSERLAKVEGRLDK